jgi:glycosyltransferase involved in cell wall biosynthesis
MKLAFVDNLPVGGGLSRFSLKLCESLINNYKDLEIDYFIHENNLKQIPEISTLSNRVVVKVLASTKKKNSILFFISRVVKKILNYHFYYNNDIEEIEKLIDSRYALAYFPSAHMMKMPNLKIPLVGTIHDFNWRYFFGVEIFNNKFTKLMDVEIQQWLNNAHCISSSNDVVNEAKIMYPSTQKYPTVIPIAQVVISDKLEEDKANQLVKNIGIDYPYIIFPGHFYPHKNHLNLFTAFYLLKQNPAFSKYKLVLTGVNTNKVEKALATYRGLRKIVNNDEPYDVIGMGYQPNEVIDALIMKATLLVSPSIYEAICTPAMDAWSFGTPTAIADIPPFIEHETTWGTKTAYFDPMNPHNIAEVLANCLSNLDSIKADAIISQQKLLEYSWDKIAKQYMDVFKKATNK